MGVMCSLLGHDYDDPDVERERIEDGDEVVLTAKRVKRCRSCGHERTISENTEVTALSAAAGVVREPDGTVVAATDESTADVGDPPETTQTVEGTVEIAEDERNGERPANAPRNGDPRDHHDDESESSETGATPPADDGDTDGVSAAVGDSSDEPKDVDSDADGGSGAITDSVTAGSALDPPEDGTVRPGADEPRGRGATVVDRIHDDEPTTRDRPRRAPGEWPAEPERATPASTAGSSRVSKPLRGGSVAARASRWPGETDTAETPGASPGDGTDEPETGSGEPRTGRQLTAGDSFACGSCGFTTAVADSPLRAGDICPGCHHGYLAWETRKG